MNLKDSVVKGRVHKITINMPVDLIISMGIMIIMVIIIEPQLEARKIECVKKS